MSCSIKQFCLYLLKRSNKTMALHPSGESMHNAMIEPSLFIAGCCCCSAGFCQWSAEEAEIVVAQPAATDKQEVVMQPAKTDEQGGKVVAQEPEGAEGAVRGEDETLKEYGSQWWEQLRRAILEKALAEPMPELPQRLVGVEDETQFENLLQWLEQLRRAILENVLAEPIPELPQRLVVLEDETQLEDLLQWIEQLRRAILDKTLAEPIPKLPRGLLQVEDETLLEDLLQCLEQGRRAKLESQRNWQQAEFLVNYTDALKAYMRQSLDHPRRVRNYSHQGEEEDQLNLTDWVETLEKTGLHPLEGDSVRCNATHGGEMRTKILNIHMRSKALEEEEALLISQLEEARRELEEERRSRIHAEQKLDAIKAQLAETESVRVSGGGK